MFKQHINHQIEGGRGCATGIQPLCGSAWLGVTLLPVRGTKDIVVFSKHINHHIEGGRTAGLAASQQCGIDLVLWFCLAALPTTCQACQSNGAFGKCIAVVVCAAVSEKLYA